MNNQQTTNQPAVICCFPREIPDSQEDLADSILTDNEEVDNSGGYDTEVDGNPAEAEKAIFGWLKQNTPKEKPRYVSLILKHALDPLRHSPDILF